MNQHNHASVHDGWEGQVAVLSQSYRSAQAIDMGPAATGFAGKLGTFSTVTSLNALERLATKPSKSRRTPASQNTVLSTQPIDLGGS